MPVGAAAADRHDPPEEPAAGGPTSDELGRRIATSWIDASGAPDARITAAPGSLEVGYLQSGGDRIFVARHLPCESPVGNVLVCSPVSKEWGTNRRREVLLAWELAASGFAVQRFCYRGCGESEGDALAATFERMVEDARIALDDLIERTSGQNLIIQGTRFGALVAAEVAKEHPEATLVLWQPFVEGSAFFREVFRAQMIGDLKQGQRGSSTKDALKSFEEQGSVEVLGDPIGWELYRSSSELSLTDLLTHARSGLLVQLSSRKQIKSEYGRLAEHVGELGGSLELQQVDDDEAWWFGARGGERKLEVRAAALEAIPLTVRFALGTVEAGAPRREAEAP